MEQIVVKTEMDGGEILLFYVDESEDNHVEGTVTSIENIRNIQDIQNLPSIQNIQTIHNIEDITQIQQLQDNTTYIMEDAINTVAVNDTNDEINDLNENAEDDDDDDDLNGNDADAYMAQGNQVKDKWTYDETGKLLLFYLDNKEVFLSGVSKVKNLWAVACKTVLPGKNPLSCEKKIRNLRRKYRQMRIDRQKGLTIKYPLFDLCHKAFFSDKYVNQMWKENFDQPTTAKIPITTQNNTDGIVVVKNLPSNTRASDNKVDNMLNLYLKYKKEFQKEYWRKDLWDRIAMEMGEEDGDYWHKRFLNFKQHYLRMVVKRKENGPQSINWPYMAMFDQIFQDDVGFQRKVDIKPDKPFTIVTNSVLPTDTENDWNDTEKIVLVKYVFDCFDEFQDPTIPDNFLWNEVGRLLDKKPDSCKQKFEELKVDHLEKYIEGQYELHSRIPLDIVLDNVIAKETEVEFVKEKRKQNDTWKTYDLDNLVKHFYDNTEMFKDSVCYFVCWASVAKRLHKSIHVCRSQWDELTLLYKTLLDDKKENPDSQIDWRYIELFDRIFNYGMDTDLLENLAETKPKIKEDDKIGVKKVNINYENDNMDNPTDDEEYDERGFTKRTKRGIGDSKAFKILEYFQKHKDKFSTSQRKKHALWQVLAKQIGITAEQCAHRYRNLKQVYTVYVQREIDKPEMPILWPYYTLCKKVFGYRAIKSKLKNSKTSEDEDWSAKEIKQIINYFKNNYNQMSDCVEDSAKWEDIAKEIGKSEHSCMEKFVELRKSYRKLKTMKENNANVKVSWKYFNLFDEIYNFKDGYIVEEMEVDEIEHVIESEQNDSQEEEDYQCIIVLPEGQDISDIESSQIIMNDTPSVVDTPTVSKWTKLTKKILLINYLNYLRSKKGKEIDAVEMWKEIATKIPNKTPLSCRKMFAKLKSNHKDLENDGVNKKKSPYFKLIEKVLAFKPKFIKTTQNLQEGRTYKDVPLPTNKIEQALQYYLVHIEEFISPRFEKKHMWTELANFVTEPVTRVFNKVNYLKKYYNINTDEVAGEKSLFSELLKEIVTKETAIKALMENEPKVTIEDQGELTWSDEEVEQLLIWYLANLEQFKDPKYSRKYLWLDVANILQKTPLACSKKMAEIRTQYRNMVKENSDDCSIWKFYNLCQKIYGTGKKNEMNSV